MLVFQNMDSMDQVTALHIQKFLIKLADYAEKIKIIMIKEGSGELPGKNDYWFL